MSNYPSTKQVLLKSLDAVRSTILALLERDFERGINPLTEFNCDEDTFLKAVGDKIDEAVALNPAHKIPEEEIKETMVSYYDEILDESYKFIDEYDKKQFWS